MIEIERAYRAICLACAIIILGIFAVGAYQGVSLEVSLNRVSYALLGALILLVILLVWSLDDPIDLGDLPEAGDTHQHLDYLGDTEAASAAPVVVQYLESEGVQRLRRQGGLLPLPPVQRVNETDAAWRERYTAWVNGKSLNLGL